MIKRSSRIIAALLLVVLLLSTTATALAANVTFRHLSGQEKRFDRNCTTVRVGRNRTNNRVYVSIVQGAHNTIPTFVPQLAVNGVFGDKTHEAILKFQARNNLTTDGICGPNTWSAIHRERGLDAFPQGFGFIFS